MIRAFPAGGHRLEYKRIDPGPRHVRRRTVPVLVFLHEGLGSVALWKHFPRKGVACHRLPRIVYSRYGYGKSDRLGESRGVDYMHREALEVLPELLDAAFHRQADPDRSQRRRLDCAHPCRRAAGGRCAAWCCLAPHVFVEDITVESIAEAKVAFENTDLPAKLGRYHDDVESTFRGWNDIWLHPDFRRWNIEEYLPGVRCPVLLIQGEDDQYGTAAQVDGDRNAGDRVRVETLMLPNCAHSPHRATRSRRPSGKSRTSYAHLATRHRRPRTGAEQRRPHCFC